MSGETAQSESGWTTDTVHSQIMTLLDERDKRHALALEMATSPLIARLNAIDKATDKFEANIERVPTDVDKQVGHLKELMYETFKTVEEHFKTVGEQFSGVQQQFSERDVRVLQSAAAATTAVNAALQAQKEAAGEGAKSFALAVDKSERATLDLINQQRLLLQTNYGSLNDKIIAIDNRLTRFEGLGLGTAAAQATQQVVHSAGQVDRGYNSTMLFSVISALVAVGAIAIAVLKP